MIHGFVVEGYPPAMPRDYGEVVYANHTWNATTPEDLGILLRNDAPYVGNFTVWALFAPDRTASPKSKIDTKVAIIAGSVAAAGAVIGILAVVIIVARARRHRAAYGAIQEVKPEHWLV